jgi:hypothetical protein
MMDRLRTAAAAYLLLAALTSLAGCESALEPVESPDAALGSAAFVGSARCASCHSDVAARHAQSGHAHILNRVEDGTPVYPFRGEVPFPLQGPPPGRDWNEVAYVVGGFGWKAQFVGHDGFLLTGDASQYNLATGQWVPYRPGEMAAYDCGRCHTTGYVAGGHQDGLDGIAGTWQEAGVGCEACHGPGSAHVASRSADDIVVEPSASQCGTCHARNVGGPILAWAPDADGHQFIRNYSQFDEMKGRNASGTPVGPHQGFHCVSCHNPHVSSHFQADAGGVVVDCTSCHSQVRVNIPGGGAHTCVNCHMPYASLSAVKTTEYRADVRTHIFTIDDDPAAEMFYQAGGTWRARPFLTLGFACLQCHTGRDLDWAAQFAGGIHADDGKNLAAWR